MMVVSQVYVASPSHEFVSMLKWSNDLDDLGVPQ